MNLIDSVVAIGPLVIYTAVFVLVFAGVTSLATWLALRQVAGRPVSRVTVGVGLGVALGIATAVVMIRLAGVTEVARTIAALQWWSVAVVLVLQALALAALTPLWRTVFGCMAVR